MNSCGLAYLRKMKFGAKNLCRSTIVKETIKFQGKRDKKIGDKNFKIVC